MSRIVKSIVHSLIIFFSVLRIQCKAEFVDPREIRTIEETTEETTVSTDEIKCGGAYEIGQGDVKIVYPVKGETYAAEKECLWTLVGSQSCIPEIICSGIDLRPNNCEAEYLKILDGVGGELKLCGSVKDTLPPRRSSNNGRDLFVKFITSNDTTFDRAYKGFTCFVKCIKDLKNIASQKLPPDEINLKENSACICGMIQNLAGNRIVGGKSAVEYEFPWQVAMVRGRTRSPMCGASVINNKWILTAAHCFHNRQQADFTILLHAHVLDFFFLNDYNRTVKLGEKGSIQGTGWNATKKTDEDEKSLRFEIDEFIVHPLFKILSYDYDIALIKVDGTIPLGGENGPLPICLPPVGARTEFLRVRAIVSGWGKPHEDAGATTRILQKLNVPIINSTECQKLLINHTNPITKRMMCAGFREGLKDSCTVRAGDYYPPRHSLEC